MRMQIKAVLAAAVAAATMFPAAAQESFDACNVFTVEDAQKVIGGATAEPQNPKVRRPKVVLGCTYHGSKEGKPVTATTTFRFARTPDESARAFDEARLQFQTKPMLISGADAFWSGKTGQMHIRKGRTWVVIQVGPAAVKERELGDARRVAETLIKKL